MRVTHACQEAEARVQMLQKSLKRAIVKSKPYFELKAQFNQILEVKPDSRALSRRRGTLGDAARGVASDDRR